MKKSLLRAILLCAALLPGASMAAKSDGFSFAVIAHPIKSASNDDALRAAIEETDDARLAFVVVNGIKAASEPCSDELYLRRKALLQEAQNGLIVSLAASDWAECKAKNGRSAAAAKLSRVRELFFEGEFSFGASKIPVIRQSMTAKYRSFSENARWEIGRTMFATLNIPANNNHYVTDAGRNSEFEDRLVANQYWLHRVFTTAARKRFAGIVLFCDGNPLAEPGRRAGKRDGYAETRRHIRAWAAKFPGKVLLVYGDTNTSPSSIQWQGNLGTLGAGPGWVSIAVNRSAPVLFRVADADEK